MVGPLALPQLKATQEALKDNPLVGPLVKVAATLDQVWEALGPILVSGICLVG